LAAPMLIHYGWPLFPQAQSITHKGPPIPPTVMKVDHGPFICWLPCSGWPRQEEIILAVLRPQLDLVSGSTRFSPSLRAKNLSVGPIFRVPQDFLANWRTRALVAFFATLAIPPAVPIRPPANFPNFRAIIFIILLVFFSL